MTQRLWDIVKKQREDGLSISDEEALDVYRFCLRKMEVAKVKNKYEYLPLLYEDELRHYLIRRGINAKTMIQMMEKEAV